MIITGIIIYNGNVLPERCSCRTVCLCLLGNADDNSKAEKATHGHVWDLRSHSTCTRNKGKTKNMFVCILNLYFVSSARLLSLRI